MGLTELNRPVIVKLRDRLVIVKSLCVAADYGKELEDLPPDHLVLDVTYDTCESTDVDNIFNEA
jgi:hypothetical protein